MGSKGLKALVVDRNGKCPDGMADADAFKKAAKVFAKAVKEDMFSGYVLPPLGTAVLVAPILMLFHTRFVASLPASSSGTRRSAYLRL